MIKKTKKANIGIAKLLALVLASLLVVIVFYFMFSDSQFRILDIIPGYKTSSSGTEEIEILRYDILSNKVQYYDGTAFLDFPKDLSEEIKIGTKNISHNNARYYFADGYYYDKNLRDNLKLFEFDTTLLLQDKLYPPKQYEEINPGLPFLDGCVLSDPFYYSVNSEYQTNGDLQIVLIPKKSRCTDKFGSLNLAGGLIKVGILGDVEIRRMTNIAKGKISDKYEPVRDQEVVQLMKKTADEWRDSILSQPMQLKYNNNKDCILVKVQKITNNQRVYLVTDLINDKVGTC